MHTDEVHRIKSYLELHHQEMIKFLRVLVGVETPSGSVDSQYEIFDILKNEFE